MHTPCFLQVRCQLRNAGGLLFHRRCCTLLLTEGLDLRIGQSLLQHLAELCRERSDAWPTHCRRFVPKHRLREVMHLTIKRVPLILPNMPLADATAVTFLCGAKQPLAVLRLVLHQIGQRPSVEHFSWCRGKTWLGLAILLGVHADTWSVL